MHSSLPTESTETSALNGCQKIDSDRSTIRCYKTFHTTTKSIPQRCSTTTTDDYYYYDRRNVQQHNNKTDTDTIASIYVLLQRMCLYFTYSKYCLKQQQQQQWWWCNKISLSALSSFIILLILFVPITYRGYSSFLSSNDTVQFQIMNKKYYNDNVHDSIKNHINESDWRWDHNVYQHPIGSMQYDKHHHHTSNSNSTTGMTTTTMFEEEEEVDDDDICGRNLLIVQIVYTVRKSNTHTTIRRTTTNHRSMLYMSTIASDLADITNRPNRAYARQWNRNFVQVQIRENYDNDNNSNNVLYTISHFLKRIRDEQQQMLQQLDDDDPSKRYLPYDAIAFLLPGTIIIDLDYDIIQLIPIDKLISLSIGVMNDEINNIYDTPYKDPNGIILVNLQHSFANVFIDQWWNDNTIIIDNNTLSNYNNNLYNKSEETIHQSDRDNVVVVRHLIEITKSIVHDNEEELRNVIFPLKEYVGGFVLEPPYNTTSNNHTDDNDHQTIQHSSSYCIKGFSIDTNESQLLLTGIVDSQTISLSGQLFIHPDVVLSALQTVADAVCYRYYPKCEIL